MNAPLVGALALLSIAATDRPLTSPPQDLVATAIASGSLDTLVSAVQAAALEGVLRGEGPFTVFAPSDAAFAQLPAQALGLLLEPQNRPALVAILEHHVVAGRFDAAAALGAGRVTTLAGTSLELALAGGRLQVGGAKVIRNDVESSNGMLHVIDTVLLPPGFTATSLSPGAGTPAGLIETAIERGVPLYNSGNETACAAVYEVAAAGLLQIDAVPRSARDRLSAALQQARRQPPGEAAWTLRRALDSTYAQVLRSMADVPEQPDSSPAAPQVPPSALFDFQEAEQIAAWRPLNDTVMGGRSSSRMESLGGNGAAFRGTTSLENRGGFASVRAPLEPGALAGAAGIELRVRGDGRTYRLLVAEDRTTGRGSYDAEFETFAGVWGTVRIPFDDMRLNIRGRRPNAPPPLAEEIQSIGLLIGDKRSGDFALEVEWIRPYR